MNNQEKIYIVKQANNTIKFLKALTQKRDLAKKKPGIWSVDGKTEFKKLTPPEYKPAPKYLSHDPEAHFGPLEGKATPAQQARRLIFEALLSGARKYPDYYK